MFLRLQWRMTLYFTLILVAIMFVTNAAIYFFMVRYNNYQLSAEITNMLKNIEGQEWLVEYVENSEHESSEQPQSEISVSASDKADRTEVASSSNPSKEKDNEEDEKRGKTVLPLTKDLIIPKSLNTFSFYSIYTTKNELVQWKADDNNLLDKLISQSKLIESMKAPKVIVMNEGQPKYYLLTRRPILIDGQNLGSYCVGRDITIAYETLGNLVNILIFSLAGGVVFCIILGYLIAGRTIKPIKQAYESKQHFLANVSHELRTPLSVIMLSSDTLEGEIDSSQSFQREIITDIKDETKKMGGLIENLLLLARSDSHRLIKTSENFNLSDLVIKETGSFNSIAGKKNVQLIIDVEPNVHLEGDKKLITSVISILTDNGIKYTKEGGKVAIHLKKETRNRIPGIQLVVSDTGSGIPESEFDHIFERFYRLEASRSKKTGGYGLGLSIAQEIVKLHHGDIRVSSRVGVGSEFTVFIPEMPSQGIH